MRRQFQARFVFKGGPEPLEKETNEILGSKQDMQKIPQKCHKIAGY